MGEHALARTEFDCESAHVTNGGSGGIYPTARPVSLPMDVFLISSLGTGLLIGESNMRVRRHGYNTVQRIRCKMPKHTHGVKS